MIQPIVMAQPLMWLNNADVIGGNMWWLDAMIWADQLVYAAYDNWRLPDAHNLDGSGPEFTFETTTELGCFYFIESGNTSNGPDWGNSSGPFINTGPKFWIGTWDNGPLTRTLATSAYSFMPSIGGFPISALVVCPRKPCLAHDPF